jgi:leucyl/phenylalanyl-tRNA---protein transferase
MRKGRVWSMMDGPSHEAWFPPVGSASDDGLLMVGGPLEPSWVVAAYRQGIFPWPIIDRGHEILAWFSPDPRAVIELDHLYVSRRLARRIRQGRYGVTCDRDFAGVINSCRTAHQAGGGTWITPRMVRVYCDLHRLGYAHSIEVWHDGQLVGGLYGISLGAFFAGESMFHCRRDASKVALVFLVAHLRARGFLLFDIQQATRHAVRMGAVEIPRAEFLDLLSAALARPVSFGRQLDLSRLAEMIAERSA